MASLIMAIVGPFSTYELYSFFERLLYWGGLTMGLLLPAFLIRTIIYRYLSGPPLRQDLIAAAILSIILGTVIWLFNIFAMGFELGSPRFLVEHIGIVVLILLVPVTIRAYLRMSIGELQSQEAERAAPQTEAPVEPAPTLTEGQTSFLRRLEPEKRGDLWRVSADDHHLQVWTDQGGSKVRLRFGDALEELTDFNGTRIHRSHWVAFHAIRAVEPDGRRHIVELSCGTRLPVSQNGLRALRAAGVSING